MIRSQEALVPRDQPDNRGLGDALDRAADGGPAEAELQRQAQARRTDAEMGTMKATRALFIDALYRAKALNGDAAFDIDDLDDLDRVEGISMRLTVRRKARIGGGA